MRRVLAIVAAALLALGVMLALRRGGGERPDGGPASEEPPKSAAGAEAAATPARATPPAGREAPPAAAPGTTPGETPGLVEVTEDGPTVPFKGVLPDYDKARRGVLNIMETPLRRARDLKFLRDGGVERIDAEVLETAISLAEDSPDAEARAMVCRALHGVTAARAVETLLRRLRVDVEGVVRVAAARSLGEALGADGVRAALEHASMRDGDEKVREAAATSLIEEAK